MRLTIIALALLTPGCSVGMAMSGHPNPDLGVLSTGQSRDIVLFNFGQPAKTMITKEGRIDVYHLQRGNKESASRAVIHAAMDVITIGLWEIVGTTVEALVGHQFTVTIKYDKNDKVIHVNTTDGHSSI